MTKGEVRELMARRAAEMSAEARREKSRAVCARFRAWEERARADVLLSYAATPREVNVGELTALFLARGDAAALPRVMPRAREMEMLLLGRAAPLEEQLERGAFGIYEPRVDCTALFRPADFAGRAVCCCVPAVALDRRGNRVGHGAGYYDRYLARLRDDCRAAGCRLTLCGICFSYQLFERVPADARDVRLDVVFTEDETVVVR